MRTAILGIVLALGACTSRGGEREAARATAQRSFQVGEFQAVSLEGAQDVVVTVGGAPSVRAEGDAEQIERLDIRVENGTLKIGTRREGWFNFRHRSEERRVGKECRSRRAPEQEKRKARSTRRE